jgi:hypothetical protein
MKKKNIEEVNTMLTLALPDDHNGRPWRPWQPFFPKVAAEKQATECKICGENKPTFLCTVTGYRESGQRTPVLKIVW